MFAHTSMHPHPLVGGANVAAGVCVCVCVCARARACVRARVCACVCARMSGIVCPAEGWSFCPPDPVCFTDRPRALDPTHTQVKEDLFGCFSFMDLSAAVGNGRQAAVTPALTAEQYGAQQDKLRSRLGKFASSASALQL